MDITWALVIFVLFGAGGIAVFTGFYKVGEKNMNKAIAVCAIGAVCSGLVAFDILDLPELSTSPTPSGGGTEAPDSPDCVRQDDGSNELNLATYDNENPSGGYIGVDVSLASADGSTQYETSSTTTGSSLSWTAIDTESATCKVVTIFGKGNASVTSFKYPNVAINVPIVEKVPKTALSSAVNAQFRDSAYTVANCVNTTYSNSNCAAGTTVYHNETLGSGGSANFYLDLQLASGNTAFGNYDDNPEDNNYYDPAAVIISAYIADLAKNSAKNSISLTGQNIALTEVTCPADIAVNRRASKCWSTKTLKSTDGLIRLSGTVKCDLGDCDVTDYITLYVDDVVWFEDVDGKIKKGSFNAAGTGQGEDATTAQINFV